jgi:hypothetical protein
MMARRWVLWSMGAIAAVVVLGALEGALLCSFALRPPRRPVAPNKTARTVEIVARDGARLRAWLFAPASSNGDAVLILHGISDSRGSQVGLARIFLDRGYTVLTPDNRAQGESGGQFVTYGLREADDVHRWVSWLIAERHPHNVFGLGESLGGAVLIQSLAVEPRFSAIVAESSFSSLERIAWDRVGEKLPLPRESGRWLAAPLVWAKFVYARVRYGLNFWNASPRAAIARSTTPVLLIHGLSDTKTPPVESEILEASDRRYATLWLVPGAGHTGAFGTAPREFEERVFGFFQAYQNLPPGIQVREK